MKRLIVKISALVMFTAGTSSAAYYNPRSPYDITPRLTLPITDGGARAWAVPAFHRNTSYANHPMITYDADTLGKGAVHIQLNGDVGNDKETYAGETSTYNSSQIASTVGVGVTDKIDVTFGYIRSWGDTDMYGTSFKDDGWSDFSLGMKWRVYAHEGFSVAVRPRIGYSYAVGGPEDIYTISYGADLIFTKKIEPFAFHLNAGYTFNDYYKPDYFSEFRRNSIWNFSLATTYEVIAKRLKLVADFGTATNEVKSDNEMPVFALAGLIYSVNKNIDMSVGAKFGLNKPENDITGTFGMTLKLF